MRRLTPWLFLLVLTTSVIPAYAEPPRNDPDAVAAPSAPEPQREMNPAVRKPVAVSLELLGKAGLYSVNVDVTIARLFGIGGGFMYLPLTFSGITFSSSGVVSTGGTTIHAFILPVYGTFSPNEGTNRFQLLAGADLTLATTGSVTGVGINPFAGLGYEARTDIGFLFRATLYGILGISSAGVSFLPWIGLSFGWAF